MRKFSKRAVSVAAVTAVLLGGGGVAYAYWTATGTGSGTGTTSSTSLAVNAVQSSTVSNLAPGGAAQDISGTFVNLNAAPTFISTLTVSITSVTGGAGSCDATDYTLSSAVVTVNAKVDTGTAWSGPQIAFNNKLTNQDGCKGATVNFGFTVA